jgi:hypothetical protein
VLKRAETLHPCHGNAPQTASGAAERTAATAAADLLLQTHMHIDVYLAGLVLVPAPEQLHRVGAVGIVRGGSSRLGESSLHDLGGVEPCGCANCGCCGSTAGPAPPGSPGDGPRSQQRGERARLLNEFLREFPCLGSILAPGTSGGRVKRSRSRVGTLGRHLLMLGRRNPWRSATPERERD